MASEVNINSLVQEFKEGSLTRGSQTQGSPTQGSEKAFNELFNHFQKPIYYLAMRFLNNHSDADEVIQKTFMQVYLNIHNFRQECSFKTWLYRIAVNQCKDHIKSKEQQISKVELHNPSLKKLKVYNPHPLKKVIGEEHTQILLDKIDLLSNQQKTAVMLRVFDDLPFKEIADVLECTESTAKVHYHQAILKLKDVFKDKSRGELR